MSAFTSLSSDNSFKKKKKKKRMIKGETRILDGLPTLRISYIICDIRTKFMELESEEGHDL